MKSVRLGAIAGLAAFALLAPGAHALTGPGPATTDAGASWVSAPAQAPPTPNGASPSPYPVPLGYVGDMEFWQPNRGLLITAGSGVVPEGLYSYNGVGWHELSTVCGGTDGRIAWAGPNEFWTIADQRPGQVLPSGGTAALEDVSLCHFDDGVVVGSYALPLDQPDSYEPMNAAACSSPDNCWFGGELDSSGAFHLYWNGTVLTVVDAPQDHAIASMALDAGQIFESVQLAPTDSYSGESQTNPPVLHIISPGGGSDPFVDQYPTDTQDACAPFCPPLPNYGETGSGASMQPVAPDSLDGLSLSSDSHFNSTNPAVWAVAGPDGQGAAHPIALFYQDGNWTQVIPDLTTFPNGDAPIDRQPGEVTPTPVSTAAEPGENAAWIAVDPSLSNDQGNQAYVDRLVITGTDSAEFTDEDVLGDAQGVGPRGGVSAISCPGPADCWAATTEGWLYHLTTGARLTEDTDAYFDGVISYRPPDSGVPSVNPTTVPVGTGLPTTGRSTTSGKKPHRRVIHEKPVLTHLGHEHLIDGTTLVLSFDVTTKADVELLAKRHGRVVASTGFVLFRPGRRTLELRLNVKQWPTALQFKIRVVKKHHKTKKKKQ
jgi:hypothetical protein